MAGDLYYLEKDGQTAICERAQIAPMEAKGWQVTGLVPPPDNTAAPAAPEPPRPKPGMVPVWKDRRQGWIDQATRARALADGWKLEPDGEAEVPAEGGNALDDAELRTILEGLDPGDDDLWNKSGTLSVRAFNEQFGASLTAADVERAWPGFDREALAE